MYYLVTCSKDKFYYFRLDLVYLPIDRENKGMYALFALKSHFYAKIMLVTMVTVMTII